MDTSLILSACLFLMVMLGITWVGLPPILQTGPGVAAVGHAGDQFRRAGGDHVGRARRGQHDCQRAQTTGLVCAGFPIMSRARPSLT